MAQTTITEALAELKIIGKRIEKKREFILTYLIRQEIFKDPLEKDGGTASAIQRELQSVHDLEERAVSIRRGIQQANESTTITVGKQTRSISDWLVWRREIAPKQQQFLTSVRGQIDLARREAAQKGRSPSANPTETKSNDLVVNINEQDLTREIESLEEILGTLDGQLSLKNATVLIDV